MSIHWLWITPASGYQGGERPRFTSLPADEWRCAPQTRPGDLALLFHPQRGSILGILAVRSEPRPLWSPVGAYACRFEIVTRFEWPVPIREVPDAPWRLWSELSPSEPVRLTVKQWDAVLRRGLAVPV